MKKYVIINLLMLLYFPLCSINEQTQKNQNHYDILGISKKAFKSYTQAYSIAFSTTFIHEFGHWITNKTLLGRKGIILINPFQILPSKGYMLSYNTSLIKLLKDLNTSKNPKQIVKDYVLKDMIKPGNRAAIMSFSGPLFGFCGSLGILKANTMYAEYKRNGKNFKSAFNYGMHQPLFNKDQDLITQLMTSWGMIGNILQLFPIKIADNRHTDGYHILSNFKITPQTHLKIINSIAGGSLALTGLLVYQIYKANI